MANLDTLKVVYVKYPDQTKKYLMKNQKQFYTNPLPVLKFIRAIIKKFDEITCKLLISRLETNPSKAYHTWLTSYKIISA